MHCTARHILINLLLLLAIGLQAQPGDITKTSFLGVKDGLADRIIMDITASDNGIFHIHTPSVIQSYDGESIISTLRLPSYNQNQHVIDDTNTVLQIDKNNCVSVITKSPLQSVATHCIADYIDQEIYNIISSNDELIVLAKTQSGYIYYQLEADQDGINILDETPLTLNANISTIRRYDEQTLLAIDDEDKIHIVSDDYQIISPTQDFHPRKFLPVIFKDTIRDVLYFSLSQHAGIYKYDGAVSEVHEDSFITVAAQDMHGNIILALSGNIYNHQDNALYINQDGDVSSWPELLVDNNRLRSIYSTDFNDYIIASSYNGIYYYDISHDGIDSHLNNPALQAGEFGYVVRWFTQGHDGLIKTTKESGGAFTIVDGIPQLDPILNQVVGYGAVWIEYVSSEKTYWIAQYNRDNTSSIISYNIETKEIKKRQIPLSVEKIELTDKYIWAIGHNQRDGKVIRYNRHNGEVKFMFDDLLIERPLKASYFSDSLYLFGCRGGLISYNPYDNKVSEKLYNDTKDLSISYLGKINNSYAVGTYGDGLYLLDESLQIKQHITIANSQAANTPAAIETDQYGNYWISTFDGIHIYNHDFDIVEKVSLDDGLSSPEFNRSSSIRDNNGNIHFGNLNGYSTITPSRYFENKTNQDLFLEELRYQLKNNLLIANINNGDVTITGKPSKVEMKFAKPRFDNVQRKPNLAYYNINISPPTDELNISENTISVSNLDFDKYTITAIGRQPGAESFELSTIHIKPNINAILRTAGIVSLVAGTCLFFSIFYIKKERRKNKDELLLQQEMNNLKMKALRSQLNPHFIFNSLNSIQYFIQVNDKKQARDYLTKFARLMRSSLDSSYEDRITIQGEIEQLKLYLSLEKLRFEDRWDYNFYVSNEIDVTTYIPSMLIQPVLENAIIHGVSHLKERKGQINISFSAISNGLVVKINDNGIGRKESALINKKRQNHKSRATSITQERVNLINRYKDHQIKISYQDLTDNQGIASGTVSSILIKKIDS